MPERFGLPPVPPFAPDDAVDDTFYPHELALERGNWPEPSAAPFPLPDEALIRELPLEPAPFPPDDPDQVHTPDQVEPY